MNARIYFMLAVIAVAATGCFSTRSANSGEELPPPITSFKAPEYATASFRRVAVIVDTSDLEWRYRLERKLAEVMNNRRVPAVAGSTMLFPTRSWTEPQEREALAKNGFDAYLRLDIEKVIVDEQQIPSTTTTTTKREKNPVQRGTDSVVKFEEKETVSTTNEGGYTKRTVRVNYRSTLIDIATGNTVWIGMNWINGFSESDLAGFSDYICGQLLRDGLLVRVGV